MRENQYNRHLNKYVLDHQLKGFKPPQLVGRVHNSLCNMKLKWEFLCLLFNLLTSNIELNKGIKDFQTNEFPL